MVDNIEVAAGSVVRIQTTGGGGWGDPLSREPELVAYDMQCGLVTEDSARDDYGVVVRHDDARVEADIAATATLRSEMRASRGALAMFDRGAYVAAARACGPLDLPEGWEDPDAGWWAETPSAEAAE